MPGRILLTTAAAVFVAFGVFALFAPLETASVLAGTAAPAQAPLLQAGAAGLLGLGVTNWMARGGPVGGVYGRPLATGDLTFCGVAALSLGRAAADGKLGPAGVAVAAVFGLLALGFAWLAFLHRPSSAPTR